MNRIDKKISIIGTGNMGSALLNGIVKKGNVPKEQIFAADINKEKLNFLKRNLNINTGDNLVVSRKGDIVILAVKPDVIYSILQEIKNELSSKKIIVSIAAGVTTSNIEKIVGKKSIIRVMPNTPALIGLGISALCKGKFASNQDLKLVEMIFKTVGKTLILDEDKMNIITAISGSGPAYLFYLAEFMIKAGEKNGLTKHQVNQLVKFTLQGAGELLVKSSLSPQKLRKAVTSPGGTTQAALDYLDKNKWGEILIKAIERAKERADGLFKNN